MMFRMLGKKVELIRYIISWQQNERENCISEQHKNEVEHRLTEQGISFTVEIIDQKDNAWFNGLEFDSYDEALEVFNKGEETYKQKQSVQQLSDNLRLRADIDYLAIMSGVII